jgi:GT2 family glycosyltransferase
MRCLQSLIKNAAVVVYADSGSTDDSIQSARRVGAIVVQLDNQLAFTAARARNAGFQKLQKLAPELQFVQFVDGDCELDPAWPEKAIALLTSDTKVAAVCGRRREQFPEKSIYNWLCEQEWQGPVGEVQSFGGDVMMRTDALESVGGYRDHLIAGEEPELCVRLRTAGWRIWRLGEEMTSHDAAMTHFGQWWRRSLRAGYAFAQGAYLHGASPERFWVWEARRAWLFGIWLPITCLALGLLFPRWGWIALSIYPLHLLQKAIRGSGPLKHRCRLALFYVLVMFPQGLGQIKFLLDRMLGREVHIIEYK